MSIDHLKELNAHERDANITFQDDAKQQWPVKGLEQLGQCPICEAKDRVILHEELEDRLFSSPGVWTMFSCQSCQSAYLDPRPNRKTIHLAYSTYYTHFEVINFSQLSIINKLKRILAK